MNELRLPRPVIPSLDGFVINGRYVVRREAVEADLPYFAGILDGEGTIDPSRRRMCVTNTHRPLLDWIAERWGGCVNVSRNYMTDGCKRKPKWCWTLSGRRAFVLLVQTRPYLLVKAERADEALELWGPRWMR